MQLNNPTCLAVNLTLERLLLNVEFVCFRLSVCLLTRVAKMKKSM